MADDNSTKPPRVTSLEIGPRTRAPCWVFGIALVSAGGVAAFVSDNQAGTTALVLFGGLLLFIAITQRVPLLIEVGTTKLDTSYELDVAFEAGRDAGSPAEESPTLPSETTVTDVERRRILGNRYRGAVAAAAAGVTYRQLDYWLRTELVTPSRNPTEHPLDAASSRQFTGHDVILLRLVKELLDSGLSLQQIRQIIETLRPVDLAGLRGKYVVHDRNGVEITSDLGSAGLGLAATVVLVDSVVDRVVEALRQFSND